MLGLVVVAVAAGLLLADRGFVGLNQAGLVLPRFDVRLIPYHDPRFTKSDDLLAGRHPFPRVLFTGDSRVMNGVDPEALARVTGETPGTYFNFATGSQTVRFAREALIPHLVRRGFRPDAVVFGVTPEWLLDPPMLRGLVGWYRQSPGYWLTAPPAEDEDLVDRRLTAALVRHSALYRYRADLFYMEILGDVRCWTMRDCDATFGEARMPRREMERRAGYQTAYGWNPQPWDGYPSRGYDGAARFGADDPMDADALAGLVTDMRRAGIRPVFVLMPVHPSFRARHEPAMSRLFSELERFAARQDLRVLRPRAAYDDPALFTDGHHLSTCGARVFADDLAEHARDL